MNQNRHFDELFSNLNGEIPPLNHLMGIQKVSRKILILFLLCSGISDGFSQEKSIEWFPKKPAFPLLQYDLLEVQPYVGIFAFTASEVDYDGVYIPANIGFRKSMLQWEMLSMQFDFALGVGAFSQFEIIRFDANTLRGGLLNIDFKASGFLAAVKGRHKFRFQLFHMSSHLGDDYILRNQDFEWNDKSKNYEQIELHYLIALKHTELYSGLGFVITPNAFRERFMFDLGFQSSIPLKAKMAFTFGSDVKFYEEYDFTPDIHAAIGVSFVQREEQQINLSVDTYYGSIPYSTLGFGQVFWLGVSTRIYL